MPGTAFEGREAATAGVIRRTSINLDLDLVARARDDPTSSSPS
jgi:hypothetical protein